MENEHDMAHNPAGEHHSVDTNGEQAPSIDEKEKDVKA